jgi:hypothetical protein
VAAETDVDETAADAEAQADEPAASNAEEQDAGDDAQPSDDQEQ